MGHGAWRFCSYPPPGKVALALRENMGVVVGALPSPEDALRAFTRAELWLARPPPGLVQPLPGRLACVGLGPAAGCDGWLAIGHP